MKHPKDILFRCDASSQIGGGHLSRCLTLARALENNGHTISFCCNAEAWEFQNLKDAHYKRIEAADLAGQHYDLIIIDHYGMDKDDDAVFRQYSDKIMVIDDLANRTHDCDILLDFSPSRKAKDYNGLIPTHCQVFAGIDYIILREEFFESDDNKTLPNTPYEIFITMGSIDGAGKIPEVLAALENNAQTFAINVMVTDKTKTFDALTKHQNISKHAITIHKNVKNPVPLMRGCDVAISAGGMTCLELVALNVPTLAIIVADNQIENVETLHQKNLAQKIDNLEAINKTIDDIQNGHLKFEKLGLKNTLAIIPEIEKILN